MSALDEMDALVDKHRREIRDLIYDARVEAFEEGVATQAKIPSDAEFRKAHKEPVAYGEDLCMIVACRSKKTAAKLLECDEDSVEEIGVGWKPYEQDGELLVGYYVSRSAINDRWYAWGVWL